MIPTIPETDQLVEAFDQALIRSARRLGLEGTGVLLAVSGGADSMALLVSFARVAARLSLRCEVATVDHGLRPEAAADARLVLDAADAAGLVARVATVDLAPGPALEARARAARYAALLQIKAQQGLAWLITAHTASDQAETVVMRLSRGSSMTGVGAVRTTRADGVARPLLFASRDDIEAYLKALGASWVHDAMNDDPRFQRVKVRQTVLPVIEAAAPGATRAMARFAELASEDDELLNRHAAAALARIRWADDGSLDRVALCTLERPIARRVVALFLTAHDLELDSELVAEVLLAAAQQRDTALPNDQVLRCAHGRVWVVPAPARRIHQTSSSAHGRGENS